MNLVRKQMTNTVAGEVWQAWWCVTQIPFKRTYCMECSSASGGHPNKHRDHSLPQPHPGKGKLAGVVMPTHPFLCEIPKPWVLYICQAEIFSTKPCMRHLSPLPSVFLPRWPNLHHILKGLPACYWFHPPYYSQALQSINLTALSWHLLPEVFTLTEGA